MNESVDIQPVLQKLTDKLSQANLDNAILEVRLENALQQIRDMEAQASARKSSEPDVVEGEVTSE